MVLTLTASQLNRYADEVAFLSQDMELRKWH